MKAGFEAIASPIQVPERDDVVVHEPACAEIEEMAFRRGAAQMQQSGEAHRGAVPGPAEDARVDPDGRVSESTSGLTGTCDFYKPA
jgi:hypothetical protein